ncbi:MAG: hypothetical protein LJE95_05760, partial [Acidobacteria bacterium]|nr:hypothetical protein [Acidobacteriota bacterium]
MRLRTAVVATLAAISWASPGGAQGVGGLLSPGPLSAAHAKLEGLDNCVKCHEPGHGVSAELCLKCHQPIAERIAQHLGVHRDVKDNCITCHTEHAGRDADIRPIDPKSFDHAAETGFALDGRHASVPCAKCHTTRSFLGLRPECGSCHKDIHRGELGADCARCHDSGRSFKDSGRAFNHGLSGFALVGAHADVACEKCHRGSHWKGLTFARCSSCHADPHRGKLGARCSSCHTPSAWATRKIDHSRTRFPLRGAHVRVACKRCHVQPATKVTLKFAKCRDCHTDPHKGEFAEDCASCHTEGTFSHGATFNHAARTKFSLTGRHAEIECVDCHHQPKASPIAKPVLKADFHGLSTACATCHADPHAGELGNDCASCHDTRTFHLAIFKHPGSQNFFSGQHASLPCAKCHRDDAQPRKTDSPSSGRIYRSLATDCASCHKDVHLGQLGKECASCHTVEAKGFRATRFDHSRARFHLDGKHLTVKCEQCHHRETAAFPSGTGETVRYTGMGTDCVSCHHDAHRGELGDRCATCHATEAFKVTKYNHRADGKFFQGSHASVACVKCHPKGPDPAVLKGEDPRHFAAATRQCASCHDDPHRGELGTDCQSCHDVARRFQSASRAFHKATLLPLEGRHLAVPCADCHLNGQIRGTPTRCFDCHWIRRQDDVYRTRLGEQCVECHRPTSWTAVTWDHGAATGVVLAGVHRTLDCVKCHTGGRFDGSLPTACVGCHLEDYRRTRKPDHVAAGFPTTCDTCHKLSDPGWDTVTFEHTTYQLVGVHAQQPCQACHSSGVYQGLPSQCVDCHLSDYQQTTQPNHASAGFATTCEDCHHAADPNWNNATFE